MSSRLIYVIMVCPASRPYCRFYSMTETRLATTSPGLANSVSQSKSMSMPPCNRLRYGNSLLGHRIGEKFLDSVHSPSLEHPPQYTSHDEDPSNRPPTPCQGSIARMWRDSMASLFPNLSLLLSHTVEHPVKGIDFPTIDLVLTNFCLPSFASPRKILCQRHPDYSVIISTLSGINHASR
jgi:hypothetical protein